MISRELLDLMADDNYEFWEKILKGKDIPYDFLIWISENITDVKNLERIRIGLEKGIKIEWIKLYSNDSYDEEQMKSIFAGLEYCLENECNFELVKIYLKPNIKWWQMSFALRAIKEGLNEADIIQLCTEELSYLSYDVVRDLYNLLLRRHRSNNLFEIISSYNEGEKND